MFERFDSIFSRDTLSVPQSATNVGKLNGGHWLDQLLARYSGASFNNGLYRIMTADTIRVANIFVADVFPNFADRVSTFAYDWLGRIFAIDAGRSEDEQPAVTMFEPGTGQALAMPCNLLTFHENELVDYSEAALAASFQKQWIESGGVAPDQSQCVGYKKPLYLGGKDAVDNLILSDLDVYWTLSAQLIGKMRDSVR